MATKDGSQKSKDYYAHCLEKALKRIERAKVPHAKRLKAYDRNEKAYKGIIEGVRQGRWNHAVHPPYIFEVIETMESGLIDDVVITNVLPNKPGQEAGAEALERLIYQQADKANYDEQRGGFTKNALVYGISIFKTQWLYQRGPQTRRAWDEQGNELDPVTEQITHFDGPVSDNIDPRDFMWDPSATHIDNADYVVYKYWATAAQVKANGKAEEDEAPLWMNVQELLDTRSSKDAASTNTSLDKSKPEIDHSHQFLIHEVWTRDGLVVIGNETVLLQDDPSPFWHNELPFQIGTTLTDLNRFEGQSEVTVLIALQNALWDILNQTLDNVELANNGIIQVSSDVEDPDSFQFFPGARWIVDRPGVDVSMWEPNTRLLNASQGITESLKGDLQSLAAALPYLAGAGGDSVDQKTATGISIISNMAQRRILRKKALLGYAYKRLGKQWIALNQQFMTTPLAVRIEGPSGVDFKHVTPQEIQGEYDFKVESQMENLDRSKKRTEALDLMQVLMPFADLVRLDKRALVEKVLASFDVQNPQQYFLPEQPATPQLPPAAPPMQGLLPQLPDQSQAQQGADIYQAPQVAAENPLNQLPPQA